MSSKSAILGSFLIGALASIGGPADAGNINTSGTSCQNYNAGQALDIDYLSIGVQNISVDPRPVICSVPRSPLRLGASAGFWVNGHNNAGTWTPCTVFVTSFLGRPIAAMSFAATEGAWDTFVEFGVDVVSTFDYVSVLCTLPGSAAGRIHGVTARQP